MAFDAADDVETVEVVVDAEASERAEDGRSLMACTHRTRAIPKSVKLVATGRRAPEN